MQWNRVFPQTNSRYHRKFFLSWLTCIPTLLWDRRLSLTARKTTTLSTGYSSTHPKHWATECGSQYGTVRRTWLNSYRLHCRQRRCVSDFHVQKIVPLTDTQLHNFGFNGFAIDFVECPEGLKWFLVKELNMHRTVGATIYVRYFRLTVVDD